MTTTRNDRLRPASGEWLAGFDAHADIVDRHPADAQRDAATWRRDRVLAAW